MGLQLGLVLLSIVRCSILQYLQCGMGQLYEVLDLFYPLLYYRGPQHSKCI